ncbi:MAG: hypothetical protein JSR17_13150 [Proteobacteria bacterium]|nr:hypothetical protein [Pseudomonadota bacterium]
MSKNREISASAISDWCSQLPLSDLAGSAKALYLTLQDSHQATLTYQERFEVLSVLRPTLKYISQALQKIYEGQEILTEKHRPIADLVNALHFEMINGYKLVIDQASEQLFCNQQIFIASFQSALSYCTKIIFFSYEQHRAAPQGIWLELHTLYVLAKEKKISKKSLQKYLNWQCRFQTLADIYKHCLLFAVSNPNHLRSKQIVQLLYSLEYWVSFLDLKNFENCETCSFVVDPLLDTPPRDVSLFDKLPAHCYFMDLTQVNNRITMLLSLHTNNNYEKIAKLFSTSELALPIPYLQTLTQTFKNSRKRISDRLQTSGEIGVCLGISTCHWFLSQTLENPITPVSNENETQIIDIDALPQGGHAVHANKYIRHTCLLVNQSENGFCLNWTADVPAQLQTGEIIGIEIIKEDQSKQWAIGTIRWLKNESSFSTLVGIELLSKEAVAVKSQLSDAASAYLVPTLLLPEQSQKHLPLRLITPPLPFKTGNELEIEYDNHTYAAVLQKSYSASASYQEFGLHFTYEPFEFPHQHNAIVPKTANPGSHKITD